MRIRLRKRKRDKTVPDDRALLAARMPDVSPEVREIVLNVAPYTMTSPERLIALCDAVSYIVENQLPGDFVECGVWRGGSMMAALQACQAAGDRSRRSWLYDTFDGMSVPGSNDIDLTGMSAEQLLAEQDKHNPMSIWCRSPRDEVRDNLRQTGYPDELISLVEGKVEETIPATLPEQISLLRLDTDWYESTMHELVHLYPRLVPGGVLIIDDYGHWQGCRRAVDEYFATYPEPVFLSRIDYTGRIAIKPASHTAGGNRNAGLSDLRKRVA